MALTSSGLGSKAINTFALLDQMVTILGSTKMSFWPFFSGGGLSQQVIDLYGSGTANGVGLYAIATSGGRALVDFAEPHQLPSGLYSYRLGISTAAESLTTAADDANHSFGNGTVDSPFSLGIWVMLRESLGTARSLFSKYRTTVATLREYDFRFGTDGKLVMELYDESAAASEIATSTGTALTPGIWQFVTATYDGGETAPVVNLYINGTSVHDGTTAETGLYVAMEDTATPMLIGARDIFTAPAQAFNGRVALPFMTGKELTAANVTSLYGLGKILLGV